MPTMQNKTIKAVAVTCTASRLISDCRGELGARGSESSLFLPVSTARVCWLIWRTACISNIERKDASLTKDGMLKILCSEVEGLLKDFWFEFPQRFIYKRQKEEKPMTMTRREICTLLPAALFPAIIRIEGSGTQDSSLPSAMYPFEKLPIRTPNNAEIRDVLKGKLATGESLEVHEMWLIREGTVELTVNGTSYRLGPGSVGFVRSNDEHGIKNVGTTPATYFVVAVGPGAGS